MTVRQRGAVDGVLQLAGVGDQDPTCQNGNLGCPDENGLPCLDCLLDGGN